MMISINPATGEELARFEADSPDRIEAILSAAARAQATWRERPVEARVELLRRLAVVLRRNAETYARIITLEMGKPLTEAVEEVKKCALGCDFYADQAPRFLADTPVAVGAGRSLIAYEPVGVVLAIMPWNYPLWQVIRAAAPVLAAGNALVLKHAANVTQCAKALQEIFKEAGGLPGLFSVVLTEPARVADLIADPRIAGVTLTGSTEVGAIVAAQAGQALKKQVLELGGSDPFVVLEDADVEAAARAAVKARFTNAGQSCVNAKRFIVANPVADAFVEAFAAQVAALRIGDPLEDGTTIGPMARANLRDQLDGQVQATLAAGAVKVFGGRPLEGPGFFYVPTVLDHVTPQMPAFAQETFGPAAAVIRAPSEEVALQLANDTQYGLGAAVWSQDLARAERLARRLEAGVVAINGIVASDPRLPFGGVKKSGYGRELGEFGVREFTNVKSISIAPQAPATTGE